MPKNKPLITLICGCLFFVLSSCKQTSKTIITDNDIKQLNWAAGLMGQYQYAAAVDILKQLQQNYPDNATITLDLAVAILNRQQQDDIEYAIQLAKRVQQKMPANNRANYLLGILYLYQGQAEQALAPLQQVVLSVPSDAYAKYFLAQSFEQLGNFDQAYVNYSQSAELMPYLRSAHYAAAMAARKVGKKQQAKKHLGVYKQLKNNPRALLAEYKYTRMGNLAEISISNKEVLSERYAVVPSLWHSQLQLENVDIDHMAVIQTLQPKLNTELILFSSTSGPISNQLQSSEMQSYQFPLAALSSSAMADINNDGITDAVVCGDGDWHLFLQDNNNGWTEKNIFPEARPKQQNQCGDVKLMDADHDGDIDIYIANFQGSDELFSNNGNMTFRRLSEKWDKGNGDKTIQIIPVDWDHDRDLDILLLKQNGQIELLNNQLLWNYQRQSVAFPKTAGFNKLLVFDSNADGAWELLTIDGQQLKWWKKNSNSNWEAEIISDLVDGYENFLLEDFDGDGIQELVLYGSKGIRWQLLQKNTSQQLSQQSIRQLRVVAGATAKGPVLLSLENSSTSSQVIRYTEISNQPGYVTLQLQGADDATKSLRSNFQAIGSEVRGRSGSDWIIPATFSANSQLGQDVVPKMISTLGAGKLDFIEIRWPDGVFQTELNVSSGENKIVETQRQLSSCPVLFVETESGYQFVSDLLGVGGVGFLAEPGQYVESRPWEYFMLPEKLIKFGSSRVRLKITEPMEENTYLDSIQLHRYRLPAGWSMIIDERMGVSEPLPTGKPLFYRNSYLPNKVIDANANEVSEFLKRVDNFPAPVGKLHHQYIGLVEKPQQLTLYFPQIKQLNLAAKQLGLVIDGWVEYPYSQTVFAAWQANLSYQAPSIEVLVNDQWQMLHHQIGYPAGMPRTSFLPLQGLPKNTTAIRISTNLELYFDAIRLVEIETLPLYEKQTAKLVAATMEYIGFPERTNAASNRPLYNYQKRSPYADMKTLTGDFTRYGEISELLYVEDNAFAIIGSGDSVAVEFKFDTDQEDTFQKEFEKEYYVLEARGYAKDMDLYTNTGGTVLPLPVTELTKLKAPLESTDIVSKTKTAAEKLHDAYNIRYQDGW